MLLRRAGWLAVIAIGLAIGAAPAARVQRPAAAAAPAPTTLPSRLTDQEFWRLSEEMSEPNGFFRSENLVSNEHTFQYVVPALERQVKPGGVYLGVAPDQNFTYILATQPRMAFIVDIRRGNLLEHLMYKALVELSTDRADFVSRLFSKKRPAGLSSTSSADAIFDAYDAVSTSESIYRENVRAMGDLLQKRHGFRLTTDDTEQLQSIYFAFFWDGPSIRYSTAVGGGRMPFASPAFPSYEDLMRGTDLTGRNRSYLATEENFGKLKDLEQRNLIVPVVGDFAGPKALRAVGDYVRAHGATVSAFYVSNVEQYLFQDRVFEAFARNVTTLPADPSGVFIRSVSTRFGYLGSDLGPDGRASALDPIRAFARDFGAGRIRTYQDVNARSRF